jgi:hypothetical protein
MTNRRRPRHERLFRRVTRSAPFMSIMTPSPLSLMSAITFLGSLIALLSGCMEVSLVLAASSTGSLTCQFRNHHDLPT